MSNDATEATSQNPYVKVTDVPCLYRHAKANNYYAVKKVRGKHKEHSLRTTDRKIAERRLKEWIGNSDKVDTEVEKTTLRQLIAQYQAIRQGLDPNTIVTDRAIINSFTNGGRMVWTFRCATFARRSLMSGWRCRSSGCATRPTIATRDF